MESETAWEKSEKSCAVCFFGAKCREAAFSSRLVGKLSGIVDIAIIQSLNHKGEVKAFIEEYGQIIVDECHHLSAFSFEQVLMKAKAKYVFGLTATPKRQDGQEAILFMKLGPMRMKVECHRISRVQPFKRFTSIWWRKKRVTR